MSDTPRVVVYTRSWCGWCRRAKALLARKGVAFEEIDLDEHPELAADVARRSGRPTVPQVFAGERPLGGYDSLEALERRGELDAALGLG
jgi:glutaredoxin 3